MNMNAKNAQKNIISRLGGFFVEAAQSRDFVGVHVKNGIQFRNLQQVMHFFGQMQQLQFAAAVLDGGVGAYQFADTGVIDVIDVPQVDQDPDTLVVEEFANGGAQQSAAFAKGDATTQVQH